jgi:hypothetical protein
LLGRIGWKNRALLKQEWFRDGCDRINKQTLLQEAAFLHGVLGGSDWDVPDMALVQAFSLALPSQNVQTQGVISQPNHNTKYVSVSLPSKNFAKKWVAPPRPQDLGKPSPALADFKLISADDVKQNPQLAQYINMVDRLAAEGQLLAMAELIAMLVDAGISRASLVVF